MRFHAGQKDRVSTDNDEWGRIAEDGEVVEVRHRHLLVLVGGTIRANVLVPKTDCVDFDEYMQWYAETRRYAERHFGKAL